jgi:hypothetical protein
VAHVVCVWGGGGGGAETKHGDGAQKGHARSTEVEAGELPDRQAGFEGRQQLWEGTVHGALCDLRLHVRAGLALVRGLRLLQAPEQHPIHKFWGWRQVS